MDDVPLPGREQIAAILAWEPVLRRPAAELFAWEPSWRDDEGVLMLPSVTYSREMLDFLRALAGNGFVVPFDWPAWASEGMAIQRDPARLAQADLWTVVKLCTLHVRADRFSEGHLAAAIERGWFLALLGRLRALLDA